MHLKNLLLLALVLALLGWLGSAIYKRLNEEDKPGSGWPESSRAVPVEVEEVANGPIDDLRSFTGTLVADREFVVASKVSGRVEEITVDLADTVSRGQLVARMDHDEYIQELAQAEADKDVARANFVEAKNLLEISTRELRRFEKLREKGVSSEADRDTARASQLARSAHVEVTRAQLARAVATVEAARIRVGYAEIRAMWQGGNEQRVVAEKYVEQGDTVNENAPLLRIVELDRLVAVFYVTEQDYALLKQGQEVELRTDAYPAEVFSGRVSRIAPVFRESTRQARVELLVDNPETRLKPGMFVRILVMLQRAENATIVPERALVVRNGKSGVFVVDEDGASVRWQVVELGIRQQERVQVVTPGVEGRVVTLGQQLLDDGFAISVADEYESGQ